jgi:predicted nucleic acid-binding protein
VIAEPGTAELSASLRGSTHQATSVVAGIEVPRAALLRDESLAAAIAGILDRLTFVSLDEDLVRAAVKLRPLTLGPLDAIHLVSALRLGDALDAFVTYDPRLADAARQAGLRVRSPGVDLEATPPAPTPRRAPAATPTPVLQRVVDRLVGRLRPARILAPDPEGTEALRLTVVLGDSSPGLGAFTERAAQEAIADLGVEVELVIIDDGDAGQGDAGGGRAREGIVFEAP